ncbi:FecR family protein [Mucilaginibacter auburnensis]|uniref:FecR protein n=1 Tax=Mucilaginibacter auburnensis TaxID=1457233 RepID=A0A2H9VN65_9SPHI|nr:FecR family protein [Mucilaginibacter auburnensis]PJJ79766.1 FecR protein [Mucilaginibacter auburnensis]
MEQTRFVELLTKELVEGLTLAEKQELNLLLQQRAEFKKQRTIIKDYWSNDKVEYKATAEGFKKVMDAVYVAEQATEQATQTVKATKVFKLRPAFRYAAAILLLATTLCLWFYHESTSSGKYLSTKFETKITAPRMKSRLILSDSTIVTLNSGTTFKYPVAFGKGNREVYLNGEAFFEVHKDKKHPFIIHTKEMNVKVLGTAFNVKSYDYEPKSETSLIHGSIEVTLNDRKSDRIILKPKEKLIIENNSPVNNQLKTATKLKMEDAEEEGTQYSLTNLTYLPNIDSAAVETLWLKNKLVFKNEDFESIAADMNRWYGIQIIFKSQELKKLRFTATFEHESAIEALQSLRLTEDFHFKKDGTMFYISKGKGL